MGLWKETWDNMLKLSGVDPSQYSKGTGHVGTGDGNIHLSKRTLDEKVFRTLLESFMRDNGPAKP